MVAQYPDRINVFWKGKPFQDEEGKWVQPVDEFFFSGKCRAVPLTASQINHSVSGMSLRYDYSVYMPKTEVIIPVGAKVEINRHDGLVIESTVKRAINNQFNSRIWV